MYADAVAALNAAIQTLSAEEYRAARLMLDIADTQNGHLYLTREEACELFCVGSWASVRRMLGHLADAGVIEHHTNNRAYVLFPQYETPRTTCAPEITTCADRAPDDHQRARGARQQPDENETPRTTGSPARTTGANRAPQDHQRAPGARTNMLVSKLVSSDLTDNEELTNSPGPNAPGADEQQRSFGLLTDPDVGLDDRTARQFAAQHRFAHLMTQVCEWRRELAAGKVRGVGALRTRIKRGFGAALTKSDTHTDIYLRHVPPEEREDSEEARRHKYIPDEYRDIILG